MVAINRERPGIFQEIPYSSETYLSIWQITLNVGYLN